MNSYRSHTKHDFQYKLLTAIVIVALLILSIVGVYQYYRANRLAQDVENQYLRSFHDMVDYVRDVDTLLKKALLASDAAQLSSISSEVFMQTASAKACLAQLPTGNDQLHQTSKFLSQTGDFTSYLAAKAIHNQEITDEEFASLGSLSAHASNLRDSLIELQGKLYDKTLSLESVVGITAHAEEDKNSEGEQAGIYQLEQNYQDYPTLIYDGPFSEHIEQMEPLAISGKYEFTHDEALAVAKRFAAQDLGDKLALSNEISGSVPCFVFSATRDDNSQTSVAVTKKGGMVLWMLDSRAVKEQKLSDAEAISCASDFLYRSGFSGMKESYYEKKNNTITINFAYTGYDVIMYPDLIKVKIALDNGDVVGMESRGYIMSHTDRTLPTNLISEDIARASINKHLAIDDVRLAIIPLDSKREVLCYEFRGSFNDQNYLIYINAETGAEEKILLLMETDEGVLTM